jgi:aminoglycoside phosphotransferase (APT) family kinase protein
MHYDEVHTDAALVRRLLEQQFPQWAALPIERVQSSGTDNALYRLGDELVVRLPRIRWAIGAIAKECRWLPELAAALPIAIPVPLARGAPGAGYEWEWGIYPWLGGENPRVGAIPDARLLAHELARFVRTLQALDLPGAPHAGRGVPLANRDGPTREALAALAETIDTDGAAAAWDTALRTPPGQGTPRLVHSDLAPGNLLLQGGRLTGVIDWSGLGVGDPACDLMVAWNLLPAEARDVFRSEVGADDATWARGRGWALSVALIQLPYYRDTNPALAANARHVVDTVLAGN